MDRLLEDLRPCIIKYIKTFLENNEQEAIKNQDKVGATTSREKSDTFIAPVDSDFEIHYITDRVEARKLIDKLYHKRGYVYSRLAYNGESGNRDGTFIKAVEILNNANQKPTIENSKQMTFKEIYKIIKEFRQKEQFDIDNKGQRLAILRYINEDQVKNLLGKSNLMGQYFNRKTNMGLENSLKRRFNSVFGLNSKNIAIEKASKLYETHIQFFILKNYEEKEKINDFFKENQLYKRLAKKFVLTQTARYSYNENNIFSKDIEKIAELFNDLDIQDKIKKDIDNNVVSNDKDIIKKKIFNYIGFCIVLSEITNLNNSIADNDYNENLRVKKDYILTQLEEIKLKNNEEELKKPLEAYKEHVLNNPIEKIPDSEKMLQEIFDKSGLSEPYKRVLEKQEREGEEEEEEEEEDINFVIKIMVNFFGAGGEAGATKREEKAKKQKEKEEEEKEEEKEEEEEEEKEEKEEEGGEKDKKEGESAKDQIGGELSFNKEKRSSSNRNFSLNEIGSFIGYFKTITYDFKKLITDSIGDNKDKTINSFMNKYLNILIGEKIKDNLFETNDGVIEKYKKGIINPQFLTEKIGSIDSYISLANTLMKTDDGIVKKVLNSLKPDKEKTNSINIIKFELIKNDLMNMVIEHVTNINIVKDIVMKDNFVSMLEERFQNKFNSKIGKTQQEKEVSSETQKLLNTIFAPQSSDSKTIQEYKKQIRTIDDIIENKAKIGSLDFGSVFTAINDENIFNTSFDLDTNGITFNLGDDVDLKFAKEKQNSFEKDQILKLLTERAFSKSSIDIINDALKANAEKTNKVEENTLSRVIED